MCRRPAPRANSERAIALISAAAVKGESANKPSARRSVTAPLRPPHVRRSRCRYRGLIRRSVTKTDLFPSDKSRRRAVVPRSFLYQPSEVGVAAAAEGVPVM
ncbi:jg2210 [Pararge aegeria aegeria]|uniref:Jg2210 protein n=1 Tax=Pararge aegeria aegeria TaxID=348720 RepID=A0A8S4QKT7_9NEOP|nr:jg2210 [Pararge aegeria aegeria]